MKKLIVMGCVVVGVLLAMPEESRAQGFCNAFPSYPGCQDPDDPQPESQEWWNLLGGDNGEQIGFGESVWIDRGSQRWGQTTGVFQRPCADWTYDCIWTDPHGYYAPGSR